MALQYIPLHARDPSLSLTAGGGTPLARRPKLTMSAAAGIKRKFIHGKGAPNEPLTFLPPFPHTRARGGGV